MDARSVVEVCHCRTGGPVRRLVLAAMPALLAACASGPERNPADPLEPLNRVTYRVNDALDRNIAQPIARGYNRVVPEPVRTGVGNVFSNLGDVVVLLNDFAQLHVVDGLNSLSRVVINSTFGVLGVFDVATKGGIPKHDQDFGLTLGHYGVPSGPYLVLPLFGPSTVRDAAGFGVDQYAAPTHWMDPAWRNSLWGLDFVGTRARYLNATNLLEEAALDKYLFVRDAYLARRQSQLSAVRGAAPPDYDGDDGGQGKDAGGAAATPPGERRGDSGDRGATNDPRR